MSLHRRQFSRAMAGTALAAMAGLPGCGHAPDPNPGAATPGPSPDEADRVPGLPDALQPPKSPREFRAAWVATVANIDWPSKPGLPNSVWRAEAIAILDRAQALGLNALILQVRPAADALYASTLEPWSEYLTGTQGRPPAQQEDPLTLWVTEAHRRGLELHAWFNPYRARHSTGRSAPAANHISQTKPHTVRKYGDQLWMDPAEPDAVAHTLAVVMDVVKRYDVDGVHIDDYFYPYPVAVGEVEQAFPDDAPWLRYLQSGGALDRADWRRAQVDALVQALWRKVHEIKPNVRVGISPFGLGKPALRPSGIAGFSQYDKLYADVERWLANGWLDYLAPQLYWPIDRKAQAFDVLLDYWLQQNPLQRHVWPGLYTSMVANAPPASQAAAAAALGVKSGWPAAEVLAQVDRARARPESSGHLHFSMAALMQDRDGIATRLRAGPYAQAALVPATPWLGGARPAAPRLQRSGLTSVVITAAVASRPVWVWSVWRRRAGVWRFEVLPAASALAGASAVVAPSGPATALLAWQAADELVVVRGVDALGLEGEPAVLRDSDARSTTALKFETP